MSANFLHLRGYDEQLFRLGFLAERYFPEDPNTTLLKLRQLAELLAQQVAARFGVEIRVEETQQQLLRRLEWDGVLEREVAELFHGVRRKGNLANHDLHGDHATALKILRMAWQLGVWFHRTFGDPQFRSGPFQPPQPPPAGDPQLAEELRELREALAAFQSAEGQVAEQLAQTEAQLRQARVEQQEWEALATAAEADKAALAERLAVLQREAQRQGARSMASLRQAARQAATTIELDEAATRLLIDAQLRQAGWEADSQQLRYSQGARPEKHRNRAIAEWPTRSGPADYMLFVGLTPLAAVEAKRVHKDVAGVLPQAGRYCRDAELSETAGASPERWGQEGELQVPFAFASNGRPFLQQLRTASGIWFRDLRRPTNLPVPLEGWYSPEGLQQLARQDIDSAEAKLRREAISFGFPLRPYQRRAIEAVEAAIAAQQREILLACATGTGKTKTAVALIYRALKTGRFRRVLFLVDREELGIQAGDAFKETRMESLQTFADIFGIKELGERVVESDTRVHIATVQAMVQRLLLGEEEGRPTVDSYDLIVVDECHRGYLLDRELSDRELRFRDFNDYVSKYRRVLEMFDAVKVALTATPALHTVQIFGRPVFVYSYREAVVGSFVAQRLGLKPGDNFKPYHGLNFNPKEQHEDEYVVTGVLEPSNTPADRVLWIPLAGLQNMSGHAAATASDVSAVLVKLRSAVAGQQLDMLYNKQGDRLTFAWPLGTVLAQLFDKMGWFDQVLELVAYLVALVAAGSVLASIYNSLSARRRDLAILRALGARRTLVFASIILEATSIAALGMVLAWGLYAVIMGAVSAVIRAQTGVVLDPWAWDPVLVIAPLALVVLGALAGVLPAIKAYSNPVAENLAPES
jgi:type I restriction enzyme R subunit